MGKLPRLYQLIVPSVWSYKWKMQTENKYPPFPGLGVIATNAWCIRHCRAQPNKVISDNLSDEQFPQMNILNIIICYIC